MPMFGGRGYSPRVSHPNYAGGLAQLGQTIGQGIQRGQKDARFKDWKSGVHAVEEDSGGDENLILEALWRGSELEDPRANAVMQQLIPQYQGVLDQRAASEAAAAEDQRIGQIHAAAQQMAEGGDRQGGRQLMLRHGIEPSVVNAALPETPEWRRKIEAWTAMSPEEREVAANSGAIGRAPAATTNITVEGDQPGEPEAVAVARYWNGIIDDPNASPWLKAKAKRELAGSAGEKITAAIGALDGAQTALDNLVTSVAEEGSGWPVGELGLRQNQLYSQMILQLATIEQRGANFTDMERKLITDVIGGDPTSIGEKLTRGMSGGDPAFLQRLQAVQQMLNNKRQTLDSQRTGEMEPYTPRAVTGQGKTLPEQIRDIAGSTASNVAGNFSSSDEARLKELEAKEKALAGL